MCSHSDIEASKHPLVKRIEAHPIDEFCRLFDVPDGEIATLAAFECPDIVAAERAAAFA